MEKSHPWGVTYNWYLNDRKKLDTLKLEEMMFTAESSKALGSNQLCVLERQRSMSKVYRNKLKKKLFIS